MKAVMQPIVQSPTSRPEYIAISYLACIASLLECSLNAIPIPLAAHVIDMKREISKWLYASFGLWTMDVSVAKGMHPTDVLHGYHIMSGTSARRRSSNTLEHSVVGYDGDIVHDPHPSGAGLRYDRDITYTVIVAANPAVPAPAIVAASEFEHAKVRRAAQALSETLMYAPAVPPAEWRRARENMQVISRGVIGP